MLNWIICNFPHFNLTLRKHWIQPDLDDDFIDVMRCCLVGKLYVYWPFSTKRSKCKVSYRVAPWESIGIQNLAREHLRRADASQPWVLHSHPLVKGHSLTTSLDCYPGFLLWTRHTGGLTFIKLFVSMTAQILVSRRDITWPILLGYDCLTWALIWSLPINLIIHLIIRDIIVLIPFDWLFKIVNGC